VLLIAQDHGRPEEAADTAERIIADPNSSAEELYQAAAALLPPVQAADRPEAEQTLRRLISVLERGLRIFLTTPRSRREIPDSDRYLFTVIGFCYHRLGDARTAGQLYSDGLARYPGDAELLSFRGLALLDTDFPKALDDFRWAAEANDRSIWPYYYLAWDAIKHGNFAEACAMCLHALGRPIAIPPLKAQLYEWLGIALAEAGQQFNWAMQKFDLAEALDPGNPRIRHNRQVAERRSATRTAVTEEGG
jgi:tetratricopeptide (TPR) repeat protein